MSSRALTPGLCVSGDVVVKRRRELPTTSGVVKVSPGQAVTPDTVVAEALKEGELRIVKIPEILGVSPSEALQKILVKQGDVVERGAVLAEMRGLWGLFRTEARSPLAGLVEFISQATGHIGIRAPAGKIQVNAYINGVVESVEDGRGAVIRAQATLVQGIFGVGGERGGVINALRVNNSGAVSERDIPVNCKGSILVGGNSPTLEALRCAANRGAVGFVTGSIDDKTLAAYVGYDIGIALTGDEPVSMTLIITEGFGALAMNDQAFKLLRQAEGHEASINGATQVRAGALRPEIITKRAAASGDTMGASSGVIQGSLKIGSSVRIIRVPYFGAYGRVVELPKEPTKIATGAETRVAMVELLSGDPGIVAIPRANLEVLG